jgi:hypothetical protein
MTDNQTPDQIDPFGDAAETLSMVIPIHAGLTHG